MTKANFKIVKIMRRCYFDGPCAEFHVNIVISNYRNCSANNRNNKLCSN